MEKKIEFLGYIIKNRTVQPFQTKTSAVQNFPKPKSVKQIQWYLGVTNYFHKFNSEFAHIAKPLSDLLHRKFYI